MLEPVHRITGTVSYFILLFFFNERKRVILRLQLAAERITLKEKGFRRKKEKYVSLFYVGSSGNDGNSANEFDFKRKVDFGVQSHIVIPRIVNKMFNYQVTLLTNAILCADF